MSGGPALYGTLADWWELLSPPADYRDEAAALAELLRQHRPEPCRTVLELGAGGGHLASHLAALFELTLTDLSPAMLARSAARNPRCRHQLGDMRSLRLGMTFDAVLVHDAVMYATTAADLQAVMATARAHLRPGGLAVFAPDFVRETFAPGCDHGGSDGAGRSLRYLEWVHAPAPGAGSVWVDFAFLLAEAGTTRVVHDRHRWGLFARADWLRWLQAAGFAARTQAVPPWPDLFLAVAGAPAGPAA